MQFDAKEIAFEDLTPWLGLQGQHPYDETYRRVWPNQAMQLTASKPAIYTWSVCRRERMLHGMHIGLAAADLVSR